MNRWWSCVILLTATLALQSNFAFAKVLSGRVTDASTGATIAGATITMSGHATTSDADGRFTVQSDGDAVMLRASGYQRATLSYADLNPTEADLSLAPLTPRALYLSMYGIGDRTLRKMAFDTTRQSDINAFVIDVKGDRGMIDYPTGVALATEVGARKVTTISNLQALIDGLHDQGIYTIARIVVFKDTPLATARPDLAVKTTNDTIYRDREGLAWTDPYQHEVWDYNISIAEEAAKAGFDEIQFDYLRFPDAIDLRFSKASTEQSRIEVIDGFLAEARQRLMPYNVFLAADVFGYICWNLNDTHIGQRIENIMPLLDYLSPMLYPSGFQFGIPGYVNPVQHPYEIVNLSLKHALARTNVSPKRFRPWLQAFRDYAFDHRSFGPEEIAIQVKAADDAGSNGWMLWNPHNTYPLIAP